MYYARQEYTTLNWKTCVFEKDEEDDGFGYLAGKDRFNDNLPVSQTRVKLITKENDYINANLVMLYGDAILPLHIICTQAPFATTFIDFWLMVWQQNSPIICCLNDTESEDKYWPSKTQKSRCFGRFEVVLESCQKYWGITIRKLCLKDGISNTSRKIIHLAYDGWPDASLPQSTVSIRKCLRLFLWFWKKQSTELTGPPIVHCLAGINRATSFIAMLTVFESSTFNNLITSPVFRDFIEEIKSIVMQNDNMLFQSYRVYLHFYVEEILLKYITIIDLIEEIRRQRNLNAIQKIEQYIFIYQVLKDEFIEATSISHILSELENPVQQEKMILNCDDFDLSDDMTLPDYIYNTNL